MSSTRHPLTQCLFAEALGTGVMTVTLVGSGLQAGHLSQDAGVVLLCTPIACGAILFVLLERLGPISGGHFNPAVSLAMLLQRVLSFREAAAYVVAQLFGSAIGVMLAHLMFKMPPLAIGDHAREGLAVWLSEGVATFGLVFSILVSAHYRPRSNPAIVAVYVLSVALFSSTSFANPAITIARTMTDTTSGIRPTDAPTFVFVQLIGSLLAVAASRWLIAGARQGDFNVMPEKQPGAFLASDRPASP